ncbi:MAG: diacylglycerol kinase family protein [Clostridia bacterium]|nr:diacylglycerol kinase family protein [Clostridia bacterium]
MLYLLYNPLSNNSQGESDAKAWAEANNVSPEFTSVIGLDYKDFFGKLASEDEVILAGGDGTVNRFANDVYGLPINNPLYLVKCGTGNDFYKDVLEHEVDGKIDLRPFIKNLPLVSVNGIEQRFLNGVGFGVDGDTCLIGDEIREKDPGADINYSGIAIKHLLTKFKPKHATVEVDGEVTEIDHVWIASAMKGRYYGGGMMAAPEQDRLNDDGTCTVTVFSSVGRLPTLLRFPTFSNGKHEGKKFLIKFTGKHIKVTFNEPCALQIDGETVKDVLTYSVDCD